MHVPSADTRNVGHAPYIVPAAPSARQPSVGVVARPCPVAVANGPASPPCRVTFSPEVQVVDAAAAAWQARPTA